MGLYGWDRRGAAAFLLGEFVPVSSGIVRRELVTQKGSRIVLEIDPSVPVEEVEASYIEGRANLGRKSGRMPSDKNLNLVSDFILRGEPPFREMARKEHRTVKDVRLTIGRTWKMLTQHAYERSAE